MASYSEDDAIQRVWRMLRDTGNTATEQLLTNTEIGDFVDAAVRRYSRVRPTIKVEDVNRFEAAFLNEVRAKHADVLESIRKEREIVKATEEKLNNILSAFVKSFA